MRTLICTAANETFAALLRGLVLSLQQWQPRPYTSLACLDVGLGPETRAWLAARAAHVVEPGWDLPVATPLRAEQPHLRAITARPFLPRYFPGYDVYLWIDADAWVQERFAIDWYLAVATGGRLAITPQVDRAYRHTPHLIGWRTRRLQSYFGPEGAAHALWETYFNSGVFALRADAPHWRAWGAAFKQGLESTNGTLCDDQTALNYALWVRQLPVGPLPAVCNWLCHLALPLFDTDRSRFYTPAFPHRVIGIQHLTAKTKDVSVAPSGGEGTRAVSLRFPGAEGELG
jgi:hypothetical protein